MVDYVTGSMRQSKRVGFDLIEEIYDRKTFLVFWRIFELVFFLFLAGPLNTQRIQLLQGHCVNFPH